MYFIQASLNTQTVKTGGRVRRGVGNYPLNVKADHAVGYTRHPVSYAGARPRHGKISLRNHLAQTVSHFLLAIINQAPTTEQTHCGFTG